MNEDIFIPFIIFTVIAVIVWIVFFYGARQRREVQETIRVAIQSGQNIEPETIRALGVKPSSKGGDLRWGVVLLALALAVLTLAVTIPLDSGIRENVGAVLWPLIGVAAFPGFVGLALVALHFLMPPKTD